MPSKAKKPETRIGFVPVDIRSSLAFPEPRMLRKARAVPLGRRSVQACPAVNSFERRTIEILAPFSLQLRCVPRDDGSFDFHVIDAGTRLDAKLVDKYVVFLAREGWRSPHYPVLQIGLPHFFVSDDPCHTTMMPAWASLNAAEIPGMFVSGRFPTDIWPRPLNLAFEWRDFDRDFRMKRGEPCCYLFVEPGDPESNVSLVAAKMTDELAEYRARTEGVVRFTSQSFDLFETARKYRPKKLLQEI